eukprot:s1213_g22.t1
MIPSEHIENPRLFFQRHDPFREAQELLQEARAAPARKEWHSRGASGVPFPGPHAELGLPYEGPGVPQGQAFRVPHLPQVSRVSREGARAARRHSALDPGSGRLGPGPVRAAAGLQFRHLATFEKEKNYTRKNVLLKEQRFHENRCAEKAMWAGQLPEELRPRYDRFSTFRHENGDGRSLPHERGLEKRRG